MVMMNDCDSPKQHQLYRFVGSAKIVCSRLWVAFCASTHTTSEPLVVSAESFPVFVIVLDALAAKLVSLTLTIAQLMEDLLWKDFASLLLKRMSRR